MINFSIVKKSNRIFALFLATLLILMTLMPSFAYADDINSSGETITGEEPVFNMNLETPTVEYTVGETAVALEVEASVTDGGITLQWYSNTENSTDGGTAISEAINSSYTPSTKAAGTTYYYAIATNTYDGKTAQTLSNIATVTVSISNGWDGTTITEPGITDIDGYSYYQIGSAEEFAWFGALVNGTLTDSTTQNAMANAIFTEDIDLNSKEWTPIGTSEIPYTGDFNGNGHKLLHLNINATDNYVGLFSYNSGTIRNLTIESGAITGTKRYLASFVGENNGIVINCLNKVDVTNSNMAAGGLVAKNYGSIINSSNTGDVLDTRSRIGGIACYNGEGATIINCYNTGTVSNCGITLYNKGTVTNCYNIGGVNLTSAISDRYNGSINCYYLASSGTDKYATAKTEKEMKTADFVTSIKSAYVADDKGINNGYPVLSWQSTSVYPEPETTKGIAINSIDDTSNGSITITVNKEFEYLELSPFDFSGTAKIGENEAKELIFTEVEQTGTTVILTYEELPKGTSEQICVISFGFTGTEAQTTEFTLEASQYWLAYAKTPEIIISGDTDYPDCVGYYKITSAEELAWFAGLVNGNMDGVQQNTGACAFLTNDIYLNDTKDWMSWDENTEGVNIWTPIGNIGNKYGSTSSYIGTFSGNNHAVYGIYTDGTGIASGLFGFVKKGGKITSLGVRDSFIYHTQKEHGVVTMPQVHAGGIAGVAWEVSITDCYNTATVKAYSSSEDDSIAGGIVGAIFKSTIERCYNTGCIIAKSQVGRETCHAGGIVGAINGGNINNCYNLGFIQGMNPQNTSRVSGICHKNAYGAGWGQSVENCYNAGMLSVLFNKDISTDSNSIMVVANEDKVNGGSNSNNHYLDGCVGSVLENYQQDKLSGKNSLKEFTDGTVVALLGDAFTYDSNINGGFPYLKGQTPVAARKLPKIKDGVSSSKVLKVDKSVTSDFSIDLKDIFTGTNLTYKVKTTSGESYSVMDSAVYSDTLTDDEIVLIFTANAGYIDGATYVVTVRDTNTETARGQLTDAYLTARAINSDDYCTNNDRWNGKTYYEGNNEGFWNELQRILDATQRLLFGTATDAQYTAKKEAIDNAVAELIPASRVNTTLLYENYQKQKTHLEGGDGYNFNIEDYTDYCASVSNKRMADALELLNSFFDEEGNPTEANKADAQASVDEMAKKVSADDIFVTKADVKDALPLWENIEKMLEQHDSANLTENDYTAHSWKACTEAVADAKIYSSEKNMPAENNLIKADYETLKNLNDALFFAKVGLKNSASSIKIHVRVADNYGIQYPEKTLDKKISTLDEIIPMADGKYSFTDLKGRLDCSFGGNNPTTKYITYVYVNGLLMVNPRNGNKFNDDSLIFRNGDDVVISVVEKPIFQNFMSQDPASYDQYEDSLAMLDICAEDILEVEAGKEFTLSVAEKGVKLLDYDLEGKLAKDATIFYSEVSEKMNSVNTPSINSGIITSAEKLANIGLYAEGWYRVAALNVTESTLGKYAMGKGIYPNIAASDSILVHVISSSTPNVVKAKLQKELDEVYDTYPEKIFTPENWILIKETYETGTAVISGAETLGTAKAAQVEAINTIKGIQENTVSENEMNVKYFRYWLNKLPDDMTLITQAVQNQVNSLIDKHGYLNDYQKTMLTKIELQKYNSIIEANTAGLPEAIEYNVKFQAEGDTEEATQALQSMYAYLRANTAMCDSLSTGWGAKELEKFGLDNSNESSEMTSEPFKWMKVVPNVTYSTYFQTRDAANHVFQVDEEKWHVTHEDFVFGELGEMSLGYISGEATVYVGDTSYEIKEYRLEGIDEEDLQWKSESVFNYTEYLGINPQNVNLLFEDAKFGFAMPFEDVTITAVWGPVVSEADLISAKESARTAINSAFADYSSEDYSETNWTALSNAKDTCLANLDNADTLDIITSVRKNALATMSSIRTLKHEANDPNAGGQSGVQLPDYGSVVGKVHVIVENTTFTSESSDGSLPAWKGRLIDDWYDLCENDTMMTVMLKALQLKCCHWSTGSQGIAQNWDNYDIAYLASVNVPANVDGASNNFWANEEGGNLGEFSGEPGSGWMATLNDWFINEGLQEFSYDESELENNDEIKIMFTQDLGCDLGGTWGNSDTSLSALAITGGTLMPVFDSDTTSYGIITGSRSNLKVTPTAANKNYLVKTFLNNYDNDGAYYKHTEKIPVKAGNTLYIGIGEKCWPSMNNQGAEAKEYTGTKYTIKMYNNMSDYAKDCIKDLPVASKITIRTYTDYVKSVKYTRSVYNKSGSSDINISKLISTEEKINFYLQIQNVKDLLKKMPEASKVTLSDKTTVMDANSAYKNLTAEQQLYITVGNAKNYNDAIDKLDKLGAFKKRRPSKIKGNEEKLEIEDNKVDVNPEAKVVKGEATSKVSKDKIKDILKEVDNNDISGITINVASDVEITKSNVEIPKTSLDDISKEKLNLSIESSLGNITIPNKALENISEQAKGTSVEVIIDNVKKEKLTKEQMDAVGKDTVYDISMISKEKHISSFGGQEITISLPYKLKDGENKDNVSVWYLNDKGQLERIQCRYDEETGFAIFSTNHLSYYIVGYDDSKYFTDVEDNIWFYKNVMFAVNEGLFNGTSETTFSPNSSMTRAMLVTVLHRLDGEPENTSSNKFTDVENSKWFTKAVNWSSEKNIVNGITETDFRPQNNITREQLAVMLYRYAKAKNLDIGAKGNIEVFTDKDKISSWAKEGVIWAVGNGLLTGKGNDTLDPSGNATRAQVATILKRFVEDVK